MSNEKKDRSPRIPVSALKLKNRIKESSASEATASARNNPRNTLNRIDNRWPPDLPLGCAGRGGGEAIVSGGSSIFGGVSAGEGEDTSWEGISEFGCTTILL